MLEIIFIITSSLYFIITVLVIIGVSKRFKKKEEFPFISVVVCARNEEAIILKCLEALNQQEYPEGKLEIIIVDDNSEDNTGKIIEGFITGRKIFKKIDLKDTSNIAGKTGALSRGIYSAKGEIILLTDADCTPGTLWCKTIASYYNSSTALVNGFTYIKTNNIFSGMQSIDLVYLLTISSGTINIKFPISCIGNNMSFRRSVYLETGGYEKFGFSLTEDYKLLNEINKMKKYELKYPLDKDSLVITQPCRSFKELYRQKKRWAVGGLDNPEGVYHILAVSFLANLGLLLTPFFYSHVWLYLSAFKILTDFFLLYQVHNALGIKKNLIYFPLFEIYYCLYTVLLPVIILFSRKVVWKNREY